MRFYHTLCNFWVLTLVNAEILKTNIGMTLKNALLKLCQNGRKIGVLLKQYILKNKSRSKTIYLFIVRVTNNVRLAKDVSERNP